MTAIVFPVAEICCRAREQGILTVIDGAHAPGQISLNLEEIGADFYTGNLHKWLCAPKGAGFLYARPEVQSMLEPLIVSWGWESEKPGPSQFVDHHEWWGTRDIAPFLSVPAAIQFQREHDWGSVCANCHELALDAEARILQLTGLQSMYFNDTWFAQMISVKIPFETDIVALKTWLYEGFRIEVPVMKWKEAELIRISVQGYNTAKDIEALLVALQAFYGRTN